MVHMQSEKYAFLPTGSTTAALISIHQQVTAHLDVHVEAYVALISLDFSKAFDTVSHYALASNLSILDVPDSIYNLVICFLKDRSHVTRFAGQTSVIAYINASVVQGSGFGPSFGSTSSLLTFTLSTRQTPLSSTPTIRT